MLTVEDNRKVKPTDTRPAERPLARLVTEREAQWRAFARWEDEQALREGAAGLDRGEVQQVTKWCGEALEFATRYGGAGPGAPETHLDDLVAWVERWRRAWKAT